MALILHLIRHGETKENVENILQGHMPGHLTPLGEEQAHMAARELMAEGLHYTAMVCSDLNRCVCTAHIINNELHLPLSLTPLLRERDWGPFTGVNILKARTHIDDRAETVEHMFTRAKQFLNEMIEKHYSATENVHILVVSHGLFCRVIQAAASGTTIQDTPRMGNAEVRTISLYSPTLFDDSPASIMDQQDEIGATAN